ncbi:IS66 family transposase [Catenovulum sediminis]|uniref:IS66 family transposase n=1 Tax=Catenovulum sediminis TaxID=1740262 RepID=A0ABV1RFF6_9ALTE|nr:IS66 family transposase [Catenovulum sediminis]
MQNNKIMTQTFTDISSQALDALIERVTQAKEHQLTLSSEDCALLLDALVTLASMQERLNDNDITINKLRKLAGMVQSSERLKSNLTKSKKPKQHGRKNKVQPTQIKPEVIHHKHTDLQKGDSCLECPTGKLYKFEPATFLRITGQSPFKPEQHVMERLRCNACGAYFTAAVTDDVLADGDVHQKYGYTARSLMCLYKYFAGSPFYRQGSMQDLLGVSISASTIFDQIEHVANAIYPVHKYLTELAATAEHYHLDDTTNRILNQTSVMKKSRDGKTRARTGIYTSGLIAKVAEYNIVLFQTNIGHAGEFIDEILQKRPNDLAEPILMSDALSANQPSKVKVKMSLCNSHARRQFYDVHSHFPEEVAWVIEEYGKIWHHESIVQQQNMSAQQRLVYHQQHSLPVMYSIANWGKAHLDKGTVEANSGLGKAINYYLKHFAGLSAFCSTEGAQLDNNKIENQLKLIIRDRKNAMFKKTQVGADIGDVLTSLIATCVEAGANALEYLTVLQRESEQIRLTPELYLPWNYTAQNQSSD